MAKIYEEKISTLLSKKYHCRGCDSPSIRRRYEKKDEQTVNLSYYCRGCGRESKELDSLVINL